MKQHQLVTELREDLRDFAASSRKKHAFLFYFSFLLLSVAILDYLVSLFVRVIPIPYVDKWVGEGMNTNGVGAFITRLVNAIEHTPNERYDFMYAGITHSVGMLLLALLMVALLIWWLPIISKELNHLDRLRKDRQNATAFN